jgi:hypothetical protein
VSDETPIPWADNDRAQRVLRRLQQGPTSTVELQLELPMVHVARQIWELRHWYRWRIKTGRLPNRVAVYTLVGAETPAPVAVGPKAPVFGDPELIHDMRREKQLRRRRR